MNHHSEDPPKRALARCQISSRRSNLELNQHIRDLDDTSISLLCVNISSPLEILERNSFIKN